MTVQVIPAWVADTFQTTHGSSPTQRKRHGQRHGTILRHSFCSRRDSSVPSEEIPRSRPHFKPLTWLCTRTSLWATKKAIRFNSDWKHSTYSTIRYGMLLTRTFKPVAAPSVPSARPQSTCASFNSDWNTRSKWRGWESGARGRRSSPLAPVQLSKSSPLPQSLRLLHVRPISSRYMAPYTAP